MAKKKSKNLVSLVVFVNKNWRKFIRDEDGIIIYPNSCVGKNSYARKKVKVTFEEIEEEVKRQENKKNENLKK